MDLVVPIVLAIAAVVAFFLVALALFIWIVQTWKEGRRIDRTNREWHEQLLRETRNAIQQHAHRIAAGDIRSGCRKEYERLITLQRAQVRNLDG